MFSGNYLFALIRQSDAMSIFVLLSLFGMSLLCWTLFFHKWLVMRKRQKQFRDSIEAMRQCDTIDQMMQFAVQFHTTAPGLIMARGVHALRSVVTHDAHGKTLVREQDVALVSEVLEQALHDMMLQEEQFLPVFSVSATVAPLIGLFGTVWGLIHSFVRISQMQSADIVTVAPGIAEALIATLAGLIVAIPALFMYSYLTNRVRYSENQMISLIDRMNWIINRSAH